MENKVDRMYPLVSMFEKDMKDAAQALRDMLKANERRGPEMKVTTSAAVVTDAERFIAINGSAHMMTPLIVELLSERPDLEAPMRRALEEFSAPGKVNY